MEIVMGGPPMVDGTAGRARAGTGDPDRGEDGKRVNVNEILAAQGKAEATWRRIEAGWKA
jgi:hypothetical protein